MKKIFEKLVALSTAAVMLMGTVSTMAFAANSDASEETKTARKAPIVVSKLSSNSVAAQAGTEASGTYTKSGDFTMKVAGKDLYREIAIPVRVSDITDYNHLDFWVYSANNIKSKLTIGVMSDNPKTANLDYYSAEFTVKKQGWSYISLCYEGENSVFANVGEPRGWDKMDSIKLWPYYGGNKPDSGAEIYFDDITAVSKDPVQAETVTDTVVAGGGYGEGPEDFLLFDFSTADGVAAVGGDFSTDQKLSGEGSRLSGKEWKTLKLPATVDLSGYQYMQMSIYSEGVTGDTLQCALQSDNPATSQRDEFHHDIIQTWEGWDVVTVDADAHPWGTPLGMNQINGLLLKYSNVEKQYYIDRVWMTNSPVPSTYKYSRDDSVDFLKPGDDRDQDFDAIGLLKQRYPNQQHPRLILDEKGFEDLKRFVREVPYVQNAYANVLNSANTYMDTPVSSYVRKTTDEGSINKASANVIYPLAMAYKIEGDVKYKDRLWAEIEQIAKWEQMTLNDALGLADVARPLALCYDWLYNDWTEQQRRIIRNILMKNCLETSVPSLLANVRVFTGAENHNMVTNSGIGMCALAFGDEPGYEKYCNQIINGTIRSAWAALSSFGPDGVSIEGVDYFEYGQDGISLYLAAMRSALGTDMGVSEIEGRDKMGAFVVAMNGMVQSFDFSDSNTALRTPSELLFFADLYHDEGLAGYTINNCASITRLDIRDMLYFREWMADIEGVGDYPRDFNLKSDLQPVASVRSTYENTNGMYLAFKGGNKAGHSDLDYGTFVYDALGERWFHDSGIDDYNMAGMFNYSALHTATGNRWWYYTKRAEGHNTFVINPHADKGDVDADQDIGALLDGSTIQTVNIDEFEADEDFAYGILDMGHVYTERVASAKIDSAKRGIALIKNRNTLVIQDEIQSEEPIEIYSFLHTMSNIEVSADKKTAIFTQNGKKMKATLLSPANAELLSMKAESLNKKYQRPQSVKQKKGLTKLGIHVKNAVNPTLTLVVQPMYEGVAEDSLPKLLPLSMWSAYGNAANNKRLVKSIKVGNIPVADFRSGNTQYIIEGNITEVKAEPANDNVKLTIKQATGTHKFAYIRAEDGGYSVTYRIEFKERPRVYKASANLEKYDVVAVESDDVPQPDIAPPSNTLDGDNATRWAADGECSIIWDLGEVKPVESVMLSFWNGGERQAIFDLDVSTDKKNWIEVYSGNAAGESEELENFPIGERVGRYIRYRGHGSTTGTWTSILELVVPAVKVMPYKDVAGHWAEDTIEYMSEQGYVNGVSETSFNPEGNITYAEGVTLLARILGLNISTLESENWYDNYIEAAERNNLIPESWYKGGVLNPNKQMSREEMCMLMVNAYALKNKGKAIRTYDVISVFDDAKQASPLGKEAIDKCLTLRLVNGKSETEFAPKANITRAEATTIYERLYLLLSN